MWIKIAAHVRKLDEIYLENFKRVRDDVEGFICKNEYRCKEEPWKNAKDALPRALTKAGGILVGPQEE